MKLFITILFSGLVVFGNCKTDNSKNDTKNRNLLALAIVANAGTPVTSITFRADAGSTKSVGCGSSFATSSSSAVQIQDLRMYVSNVNLVKADGSKTPFTFTSDGKWQSTKLALLDFEDATGDCANASGGSSADKNLTLKGSSAAGNYTALEFDIGVPDSINFLDVTTSSAPQNINAMYWSWKGGYKFLKYEFKDKTTSKITQYHLGSGGCNGASATTPSTSCTQVNRPTISLSKSDKSIFNFATDNVVLDVISLLKGTDLASADNSCMAGNSNAACAQILANTGVKASDGTSAGTQTAFSIK
ncbi:MAG TPA: metallo-mystery pair system four-Cys motif protein [Leptospiraceae bacterium]|nr:metallo-mystery pair system four-Cys motif protein [Leptospiraceae bacterium]HMY66462.1 metallo-mystery pair system four-Cys motif protein [Leptospiraceae bacterium]HNF16530.1 metallo-mystery pair system four-Cys motif protein [Leptospiraceae bacterium]HNI96369.1 metallo-mystery pair system four-Cys motif protein [Leptospiraceae bacterium]HNM03032.1 metallo-mystery pair system four-Cys motif protein [Leptospiraceae bacterium]